MASLKTGHFFVCNSEKRYISLLTLVTLTYSFAVIGIF